jgi:hypothetical protein
MRSATSSSKDRPITETVPKVPYLNAIRNDSKMLLESCRILSY